MHTFFFNRNHKVRAYRNLNTGCWSVVSMEGANYGRVILHCSEIILTDVTGVVKESGRQRVIKERSKNVHAYLQGNIKAATVIDERYPVDATKAPSNGPLCDVSGVERQITYNPYKFTSFVFKDTHRPIGTLHEVHLNADTSVTAHCEHTAIAA